MRLIISVAVAVVVVAASWEGSARADDFECTAPDRFAVLTGNSSFGIGDKSADLICNYAAPDEGDKKPAAGLAISISYQCRNESAESWKSKTASPRKTEVHRSFSELVLREVRTASGYAGTFDGTEKFFLRIDDQTIATLYLMSNPVPGGGGELQYDVRSFAQYAQQVAQLNAPWSKIACGPTATVDAGVIDAGTDAGIDAGPDAGPADSCEVNGIVTDRLGQPVRGIEVQLLGGALTVTVATNEQGAYRFDALVASPKYDPTKDLLMVQVVTRELERRRFDIYAFQQPLLWASGRFKVKSGETCRRDFAASSADTPPRWPEALEVYQRLQTAWKLIDGLGVSMNYGLPLPILLYCTLDRICAGRGDDFAFYRGQIIGGEPRPQPMIGMGVATSSLDDGGWPDNREYHELGHAFLSDAFDDAFPWPDGIANHAGYFANADSTDSWSEGFAEFFSMMVSKHIDGDPRPELYRHDGTYSNLELDYRPWDWEGVVEELSIAGVLLDFEDGPGDYAAKPAKRTLEVEGWTTVDDPTWGRLVVGSVKNTSAAEVDDTSELTIVAAVLLDAAGKTVHVSAAATIPPDLGYGARGRFAIPIPRDQPYDKIVVVSVEGRNGAIGNDDDPIDVELAELWGAILGHRGSRAPGNGHVRDAAELYDALRASFGGRDGDKNGMDDVDQVFIAHGLFGDDDGDRSWKRGEAPGLTSHPPMVPRYDFTAPPTSRLKLDTGGVAAWITVHVDVRGAGTAQGWSYLARPAADGTIVLPTVPGNAGATVTVVAQAAGKKPAVAARFDGAALAAATTAPAPVTVSWQAGAVTLPGPARARPGGGVALLVVGGAVAAAAALGLLILVAARRRH